MSIILAIGFIFALGFIGMGLEWLYEKMTGRGAPW